ncbi:MAG: hypothetical protein KC643_26215 [Nitrospira sp.]|nr:hypothetical protein [Nitrospira sp.]
MGIKPWIYKELTVSDGYMKKRQDATPNFSLAVPCFASAGELLLMG